MRVFVGILILTVHSRATKAFVFSKKLKFFFLKHRYVLPNGKYVTVNGQLKNSQINRNCSIESTKL